jgi:hypothetical protein
MALAHKSKFVDIVQLPAAGFDLPAIINRRTEFPDLRRHQKVN